MTSNILADIFQGRFQELHIWNECFYVRIFHLYGQLAFMVNGFGQADGHGHTQ